MPCPTDIDTDARLFEQLRPRLTAISRRIVGSEAEAEDVVQHQSIDRLRRRARDEAAARTAMELVPGTPVALPEDGLLRHAELAGALARLLACLTPAERLALVLREAFDCEHADIAAALGTTAVNARQYLARARKRLRRIGDEVSPDDKLCRELVRRFQAAINGRDLPAMVSLLAEQQPVSVREAPANDACYARALAA